MKIKIDYPSETDEFTLTRLVSSNTKGDPLNESLPALLSSQQVSDLQNQINKITVDQQVVEYCVRLVRATRDHGSIQQGAGPRASIALVRCARVNAALNNRDFVLPDDVKNVALPILRHRITLSADAEIDGMSHDDVLASLLEKVEAPRL